VSVACLSCLLQGERGHAFYIVESGQLSAFKDSSPLPVLSYGPGALVHCPSRQQGLRTTAQPCRLAVAFSLTAAAHVDDNCSVTSVTFFRLLYLPSFSRHECFDTQAITLVSSHFCLAATRVRPPCERARTCRCWCWIAPTLSRCWARWCHSWLLLPRTTRVTPPNTASR